MVVTGINALRRGRLARVQFAWDRRFGGLIHAVLFTIYTRHVVAIDHVEEEHLPNI